MRPGSVVSEEGDSLMAALITFPRTNLVSQERWKLLIPLADCPCQRAGMGLSGPNGSPWVLPEREEHRGMLPVPFIGIPKEGDQVVLFKLNGQQDVNRRRDGK